MTTMQKPKPQDYGWDNPETYNEGAWCIEGGEEAYMSALAEWEKQNEPQPQSDSALGSIESLLEKHPDSRIRILKVTYNKQVVAVSAILLDTELTGKNWYITAYFNEETLVENNCTLADFVQDAFNVNAKYQ